MGYSAAEAEERLLTLDAFDSFVNAFTEPIALQVDDYLLPSIEPGLK